MKIINELLVNDVGLAIKFYTDFLDFEIAETTGNPINWVRLVNQTAELMLEDYQCAAHEFETFPAKTDASNIIKFKFDDIMKVKSVYNKMQKNNIKIFKDLNKTDYGTYEFVVLDCDNNIIIISA